MIVEEKNKTCEKKKRPSLPWVIFLGVMTPTQLGMTEKAGEGRSGSK